MARSLKPFGQLSKSYQARIRSYAKRFGLRVQDVRRNPEAMKAAFGRMTAERALRLAPSQVVERWLQKPGNLEKVTAYVERNPGAGAASYERQLQADPNHPPVIFGDPIQYSTEGQGRRVHDAQLYRDWADPEAGAYAYWRLNVSMVQAGYVVIRYYRRGDDPSKFGAEVWLLYVPNKD